MPAGAGNLPKRIHSVRRARPESGCGPPISPVAWRERRSPHHTLAMGEPVKLSQLQIRNFRGTRNANLLFPDHVVLIGDNNTGKSTVLEAINLVLGPNRLNRRPPINEHDFYAGRYLGPDQANDGQEYCIYVEATITDLSAEQRARFMAYIEWWNTEDKALHTDSVKGVDAGEIVAALRIAFVGEYVPDEDDFEGKTYYARSLEEESDRPQAFTRSDKHVCSFLYLRSLRTGRRALGLEHGSLLDIVLRQKELRPRMWETTIKHLAGIDVAGDPELGISGVLESVSAALTRYVPDEWGVEPHLRVSALTREHLRNDVITAFIATGVSDHSAPYYRQGTGTINMLVLAMLSQIAEDRQVIFAMEEPETALPPYAQKRIVHELRKLSTQSIVTSHSPYVLEEFDPAETIVLARSSDGQITHSPVIISDSVKRRKRYRQDFRTRFCEALLSRRVLITEGATEASAFPAVARRLAELDSSRYISLEALGICTIDAGSETRIASLGRMYRSLGKHVYAACDKQSAEETASIKAQVDDLFMHSEKGFEDLVVKNTTLDALQRFAAGVTWPQHLLAQYPTPWSDAVLPKAVGEYFRWTKGAASIAEFLTQCEEDDIPQWIRDCCIRLRGLAQPVTDQSSVTDSGQ